MSRIMTTVAKFIAGNPKTIPDGPILIASSVRHIEIQIPDGPILIASSVRHKSASIEIQACKLHKLEKGPPTSASLTEEDALKMYELLVRLRRMETSAATLYKEKLIRGFCHLYSGQEAVAVGIKEAMRPIDSVITSYRCHAWTHLMGASVLSVLAELTGRTSGCSRGKGGSMHMYAKKFFGGNGIVGAQVPLGAGIAFAHKYKGDGGVCFALYGDGAANQGQLFEALNLAMLLKLPGVFICENNGYGMGTSVDRHAYSTDFYTRGDYAPGIAVDGMDVLATREATKFCIDYCLSGKGPIMVEMDTYRYYGHSMSDPGTSYRTRKEVQDVRQNRDPIANFKKKIIDKGLVSAEQLKAVETKARKEVDADADKARTDPHADGKEVAADIYSQNLQPMVRGCHPEQNYPHANLAKA